MGLKSQALFSKIVKNFIKDFIKAIQN